MEYFHPAGSVLWYVQVERSTQPGSGGVCWGMKVGGRRALSAPTALQSPGAAMEPGGMGLPGSFRPSSHLSSPELDLCLGFDTMLLIPAPSHPQSVFSLTHLPASQPANLIHLGNSSINSGVRNPRAPHCSPAHLPYHRSCGGKV